LIALVDTGPLVAFFNRRDRHHDWAAATLGELAPPLLTCEPVLSEVCFLLQRGGLKARLATTLVERGLLEVPFRADVEARTIGRLLDKYEDVPMSLADACLVRMSEQHADCIVITLDSDFRVYRRHGRRRIPTRMPDAT
jgi:predicted nucleic acid-binding protein